MERAGTTRPAAVPIPSWHDHLVDYDPAWVHLFTRERARLRCELGPLVRGLEHIGSTAVPDLAARPSIDILLGIESGTRTKQLDKALHPLGYARNGASRPRERVYLRVVPHDRVIYEIHIVIFENLQWRRHLAVREYLRAQVDEVRRYGQLKSSAAYWGGSFYDDVKSMFFTQVLHRVRGSR